MRVLGHPLQSIDLPFLERLAAEQVPESRSHEYRGALPPARDKEQRDRFLETVASFANTEGGVIIFGFQEAAWEVVGLRSLDLDADVRRLEDMVRRLDPPIQRLEVGPTLLASNGAPLLLLGVGRSLYAPHAVVYENNRIGFFRRTNRGKQPMDSRELRREFLEADLWRRDAEEYRASRIRDALATAQFAPGAAGIMFMHCLPLGRLDSQFEVTSRRELAVRCFQSPLTFRRSRMNIDGLLLHNDESDSPEWLQCFRHGGLELATQFLLVETDVLSGEWVVGYIGSFVRGAVAWFSELGVSEPFLLNTTFVRVRGTRLSRSHDFLGQADTFDRDSVHIPTLLLGADAMTVEQALAETEKLLWQATGRFSVPPRR